MEEKKNDNLYYETGHPKDRVSTDESMNIRKLYFKQGQSEVDHS